MTNEQAIAELQKEHDLIQSEHDLDGSQFAPALLEALAMAIEVLKYSEIPNSSDTIYRRAAADIIDFECGEWRGLAKTILDKLEALPSAQPEREKGKWIWKTGDVYKCSECETETHVDECFEEPIYNYCPYCNAFMDGYER